MKGKAQFTRDEISAIKGMLHDRGRADRTRQKAIRRKMRRLGFYITDYGEAGFTSGHLDDLIKIGRIKVTD